MKFRPSRIDIALSGKPEIRQTVEAIAADLGKTSVQFLEQLTGLGIATSLSAASRYRRRFRPQHSGPIGAYEALLITKILDSKTPKSVKLQIGELLGISA